MQDATFQWLLPAILGAGSASGEGQGGACKAIWLHTWAALCLHPSDIMRTSARLLQSANLMHACYCAPLAQVRCTPHACLLRVGPPRPPALCRRPPHIPADGIVATVEFCLVVGCGSLVGLSFHSSSQKPCHWQPVLAPRWRSALLQPPKCLASWPGLLAPARRDLACPLSPPAACACSAGAPIWRASAAGWGWAGQPSASSHGAAGAEAGQPRNHQGPRGCAAWGGAVSWLTPAARCSIPFVYVSACG